MKGGFKSFPTGEGEIPMQKGIAQLVFTSN
jgi:hypothetical protein